MPERRGALRNRLKLEIRSDITNQSGKTSVARMKSVSHVVDWIFHVGGA